LFSWAVSVDDVSDTFGSVLTITGAFACCIWGGAFLFVVFPSIRVISTVFVWAPTSLVFALEKRNETKFVLNLGVKFSDNGNPFVC